MPGRCDNKKGNDTIYTPDSLALQIVQHFNPSGLVLEPCAGRGAFIRAFKKYDVPYKWYEIEKGKDFLLCNNIGKYNWIITNPPYSKIKEFLTKSCELEVKNIVFLSYLTSFTISHRLNILRDNGYFIREILFIKNQGDLVKYFGWKQSGFALTCVRMKKAKNIKEILISDLNWKYNKEDFKYIKSDTGLLNK